jgi:hypothetical protein
MGPYLYHTNDYIYIYTTEMGLFCCNMKKWIIAAFYVNDNILSFDIPWLSLRTLIVILTLIFFQNTSNQNK